MLRRPDDAGKIRFYNARGMSPISTLVGETWYLVPAESDSPDHLRFRLLLNPMLAPNRIAKLEDKIQQYAVGRQTYRERRLAALAEWQDLTA